MNTIIVYASKWPKETERPLEVGDWIELVDDRDCQMQCDTKRLLAMTWPQQIAYANKDYVGFAKNDDRPYWSVDRFRRVPSPVSEASEVASNDAANAKLIRELSDQLSTVTAERDSLAAKLAEVEKERDELRVQVENDSCVRGEMQAQLFAWSERHIEMRNQRDQARESAQRAESERDELQEDSRQLNIAMNDLDEQVTQHKQRADKAEAKLPCGHYATSEVTSVESGDKWCGECDMQSRLSDAVQMEKHNKGQWDREKERRVYYQDIVYAVCNLIDKQFGHVPGQGIVCGTSDAKSSMVQDELRKLLDAFDEAKAANHSLINERNKLSDKLAATEADAAAMREALFSQPNGTQFTSIYAFITNNTESEFLNERIRSWCKAHANVLLNLDQSNLGRELLEKVTKLESDSLSKFQREVGEWATGTFKVATAKSTIEHLKREVVELESKPLDKTEAADCLLLLLHLAHRFGRYDLLEAAREKFKINKSRKWGEPDSEGVQSHVKDEGDCPSNHR